MHCAKMQCGKAAEQLIKVGNAFFVISFKEGADCSDVNLLFCSMPQHFCMLMYSDLYFVAG